jgi:hypothetical protein
MVVINTAVGLARLSVAPTHLQARVELSGAHSFSMVGSKACLQVFDNGKFVGLPANIKQMWK